MVYPEVDIAHLFHGHMIDVGSDFTIEADTHSGDSFFRATLIEERQQELFEFDEDSEDSSVADVPRGPNWELQLDWSQAPKARVRLPLSERGGISSSAFRRYPHPRTNGALPVKLIATAGLTAVDVVNMFEGIVLTREEQLVTDALRTIEPDIERIATITTDVRRLEFGDRGGIVVKCRGSDQRIPIGSMGDGLWRILGLALALVSAENGILLVDEIDTGLHFTVLERMWKLVDETSRRLGVQVFATTHSRDAYESLAAIARLAVSNGSEVTIQRIDRFKGESVAFSEQEIVVAAERGTEVR
jgi:hypothetical protein